MIKGILFDYGGTIDTPGIHWGDLLWDLYQEEGLRVDKSLFDSIFGLVEKHLALNYVIYPDFNFLQVLQSKIALQFSFLAKEGIEFPDAKIDSIAQKGYAIAQKNCERNKPVIAQLKQKYQIGLVSNFYGNLHAVLADFGILDLFETVVESAVVGVRKPDPAIFQLGVEALHLPANECVVVGDTMKKDIIPATSISCKTLWLRAQGVAPNPSFTSISQLEDISDVICKI